MVAWFSAARVIDAVRSNEVQAADLDGDGSPDVLSVYGREVSWYQNLGGGSFALRRVITSAADNGLAVHPADLDGDGDSDVLTAYRDNDTIAWFENRSDHGDDHGGEPAEATLARALPAFQHGTLEQGGDRDVFRFATGSGTLRVYSNGPTDTYGTLLDAGGERLATNDDGGSGANFEIEAGVSAGVHYVEVRGYSAATTGPYTLSIEFVATDDHADTRDEATVVAALPWSGGGELERANDRDMFRVDVDGPGTLKIHTTGATDTYGKLTEDQGAVLAEDDDSRDGLNFEIEVAVEDGAYYVEVTGAGGTATGPYTLSIEFMPTPKVSFATERIVATGAYHRVYALDLDSDGDPDVLSRSSSTGTLAWYANQGQGRFSAGTEIGIVGDVHAADVDGDGDLDLLSGAGPGGVDFRWFENLGNGVFNEQLVDYRPSGNLYAADLDGDGDVDVLSAHSGENVIAWFENLGGGEFGPETVISTSINTPSAITAADFDGDGDADVASASSSNDSVAWFENLGGTFSPHRVVTRNADFVDFLHTADLDADGDADLISVSFNDDKIAWYENEGGTFSVQRVIGTSNGAESAYAADLDGDGDNDVLSAARWEDEIAWYENLGEGTFSPEHVIANDVRRAAWVHAADLDGDGDPDVLSGSFEDNKVAWYENLSDHGDDHGGEPAEATLATALPAFQHGTLEQGGDRDVFRFATGSGTLRVYSNGPTDTYGTLLGVGGERLAVNDDGGRGATSRSRRRSRRASTTSKCAATRPLPPDATRLPSSSWPIRRPVDRPLPGALISTPTTPGVQALPMPTAGSMCSTN